MNIMDAMIGKLGLGRERVGYTAGVYDMFHIGHLNLLRGAKENCDRLVVGVTTDEAVFKNKNKKPVIPFADRMEIVRRCEYVDEVVAQDDLDKVKAWEKLRYDVLFVGDDWKGTAQWIEYEKRLKSAGGGVPVVYLPHTDDISSTKLSKIINEYGE